LRQIGIDVGGTFTDFVLLEDDGSYRVAKASTNHEDQTVSISQGIEKLAVDLRGVDSIFYGSTVAVNALIHGKGARCLLVTTKGFRDIYAIGRLSKMEMYNLLETKHPLLVDRALTIEVDERVLPSGEIEGPLEEASLVGQVGAVRSRHEIDSVAICFLNSYANSDNEFRAERALQKRFPDLFVTCSASLAPQWHEFERTCTTVLNAYITPLVAKHMRAVETLFRDRGFRGNFFVMQSNGSVSHVDVSTRRAVATLNSGPAAGVIGGVALGKRLGHSNILTVDMGGTSFDVGVCDRGEIRLSTETVILKHPTLLPSIDIYSIGAGGGSIAWIDDGGALQVGPQSAEADPGPAFYDKGGIEPTVSDANLVTGRLNGDYLLGGELRANREKSLKALQDRVASHFGWSVEEAAVAVIKIIDNKMAYAIRSMTIEKGLDPAEFVMIAFGGAGGLHASAIASLIGIPVVVVPEVPGNFSAFGMLSTDVKHDFVRTFVARADDPREFSAVNRICGDLTTEAKTVLDEERIPEDARAFVYSADVRYLRQEHPLTLGLPSLPYDARAAKELKMSMDRRHGEEYGFSQPEEAVQLTNLRVTAVGRRILPASRGTAPSRPQQKMRGSAVKQRRKVFLDSRWVECPTLERDRLQVGEAITGPAVIEERLSTTLLLPGDVATVDAARNIVIRKEA